ncbi:MAG: glycine--tRNA ligase subunit beta [Polyangiales bacterium]
MSPTLLLEIGCEELPTSFLDGALEQLRTLVSDELSKARIEHGNVRVLGTPRRLAVLVSSVVPEVSAREEEVLGPSESAAKTPDGGWSKAAEGFAKKNNVLTADLSIADTAKGRYLRAVIRHPGSYTASLLPAVLAAVCKRISFSKSMRWASGETAFGRPIQWIVALYDTAVIPFEFAGIRSGPVSRGHRFLAPGDVVLRSAEDYVTQLGVSFVRVDVDSRRVAMLAGLETAAAHEGGELVRDAFLEREVLGLVEEPHVVVGRFEEKYLALPDALIESVMRGHQRYFAVARRRAALGPDGAWHGDHAHTPGAHQNRLLPVFLTVVNTAKDPDTIRKGNERVMRARLSDASFFVEQDRKSRLDGRVTALDAVAFHAKLGSYGDKARRLGALSSWLSQSVGCDADHAARAGVLSKADLVTLTVGEFPELQGLMGAFYAAHDGEHADVVVAVREHYQPRGAGDDVAPSKPGAALAIADRLDTLLGCLAVGLRPTGSEDPFGLRRLAIGILRTLLHHKVRVSLADAAGHAWDVYAAEKGRMIASAEAAKTSRSDAVALVVDFCAERLRGMLEERFPRDVVAACMAAGRDNPVDVLERVEALAAFWETPAAADLAVAFKRVFNISREAPAGELSDADRARLTQPEAKELAATFDETRTQLAPLFAARRFVDALELVARSLRAPVDRFFTAVMVNAKDDPEGTAARQRLLRSIADSVAGFARFDALE